MFSINQKDQNIEAIFVETKLANYNTQYEYRVYGLKQEGNPVILISNPHIEGLEKVLSKIERFFKRQNIQVVVETCDVRRLSIGFRLDIREHTLLCSSILQTIVYALEDVLDFKLRFKIPNIPDFSAGPSVAAKRLPENIEARLRAREERRNQRRNRTNPNSSVRQLSEMPIAVPAVSGTGAAEDEDQDL